MRVPAHETCTSIASRSSGATRGASALRAVVEHSHALWDHLRQKLTGRIAAIQDRGAPDGQVHEQLRLAGQIVLGAAVAIEVVAGQVGEHTDAAGPRVKEAERERSLESSIAACLAPRCLPSSSVRRNAG